MCLLQEENTQTTFWIMGAVSMGTQIFCQNFDARLIFQTENNFFTKWKKLIPDVL